MWKFLVFTILVSSCQCRPNEKVEEEKNEVEPRILDGWPGEYKEPKEIIGDIFNHGIAGKKLKHSLRFDGHYRQVIGTLRQE